MTLDTSISSSSAVNKYYIVPFLTVKHFCTLEVPSRHKRAHIYIFHKLRGKGQRRGRVQAKLAETQSYHFRPIVFTSALSIYYWLCLSSKDVDAGEYHHCFAAIISFTT